MPFINRAKREITCKIVYYGPGLCGKTTNIHFIHDKTKPSMRGGELISLATESDRTLFFDFYPVEVGEIKGFKTKFHLYTVPGQHHYDASRKLILKGADGLVFVADSQSRRMDANLESMDNLMANMAENGLSLDTIPFVIQYNKRDLPDVTPLEEMRRLLNPRAVPDYEAAATDGTGVFDTLKAIAKLVLRNLKKGSR